MLKVIPIFRDFILKINFINFSKQLLIPQFRKRPFSDPKILQTAIIITFFASTFSICFDAILRIVSKCEID